MHYQRQSIIITFTAILWLVSHLLTGCHGSTGRKTGHPPDDQQVTAGSQDPAASDHPSSELNIRPEIRTQAYQSIQIRAKPYPGIIRQRPPPPPPVAMTPITENLPADQIVESFFGPLQQPEYIKPAQHYDVRALYIGSAGYLQDNLEIAEKNRSQYIHFGFEGIGSSQIRQYGPARP